MRRVNDMNEEKRLFGDSENDPRSPLFKRGKVCKTCEGEGGYYEDVAGDGGSSMWIGCEDCACECCEGTGKDFFSCCGVDMRGNDIDICPDCKEHTGWDGTSDGDCTECDGEGHINL